MYARENSVLRRQTQPTFPIILEINMSFLPLIVGLALSPNAYAKGGKKKTRLKLSTPVYIMNSDTTSTGNIETTTKESGISLFTQPTRLELTYWVAKGIEIGGMVSFGSTTTTETTSSSTFSFGATSFSMGARTHRGMDRRARS